MSEDIPTSDIVTPKRVDVTGRYSAGEIELEGHARSLRELASYLSSGSTAATYSLCLPQNTSPAPYDMFLTSLRIIQSEGAVQVTVDGDVLNITGSQDKLTVLAEVINGLADEPDPQSGVKHHSHVEYYPDHFYLAPSSTPLSISVREPNGSE